MQTTFIFDIKRYAINDGPGIRMVVFLKGCNLNCAWCHNPESISIGQERMYAQKKCIQCGTCVLACPEKALTLTPEGIITDAELCQMYGRCAEVCPTKAIEISGKQMLVAEIMNEIGKERVFFDQSGGGVTFSGGEPLLHSRFLIELLDECGRRGIHRAVDTAGLANTEILLEVAKRTDLFLYDLKMMDSERHREWTGAPNEKILENLKILAGTGVKMIIRIPLIGGINDDRENLTDTARFISELSGEKKEVNLLPYHKIAQTKYQKLGRPKEFQFLEEPPKETQLQAIAIFREWGIVASIGG
ncbi:MAG TPA: glycyl-radical enzyme activating protein [Prolixibacteraceae bacterium]|nr:glycyl-radical enzyme activating protein [Prolixibacteraceae bacterium]